MRTLITLMVVGILTLTAGSALAEASRTGEQTVAVPTNRDPLLEATGHATLALSPMFLEIYRLNLDAAARRGALLEELAASADDLDVDRLVRQLQCLEVEMQLDVLKVRIRFARLEGRFDQAFQLRQEMLELMQKDTAPLM